MIIEMQVPSPGESVNEVEITSWFIKNGDYVQKDQIIGEIDSDKATLDISAQESGIINIKIEAGNRIPVGTIICSINTTAATEIQKNNQVKEDEEVNKQTNNTSKEELKESDLKSKRINIPSPSARKILDEKEIAYNQVRGTGKAGRITKTDALSVVSTISMGSKTNFIRSYKSSRLSSLRRKIAERLVYVKNNTAMLTTFNEIDMSEVIRIRTLYKDIFQEVHGVKLGLMSFFTKAVVKALFIYPDINAMIDQENKINFNYCDISIAVASPKGLMVPVLRNCEFLSFRGIEQEIQRLSRKVQEGKISVDEMTGGTFTITNGGIFGSMLSTPLINPPQSAILGMHNIVQRPVVINSKIEIRPIMYIALSYDHRIIDGKDSVTFLTTIKEYIENCEKYLMNCNIKQALEL